MHNNNQQKAFLCDMTRCIGCRSCQTTCKQWNSLPAEKTTFFGGPGYQNPANLSGSTYTLIKFHEDVENNVFTNWVFMKLQCQHCLEPACVSVCPDGSLQKRENGPVTWDQSKCIGCKSCSLACPFDVPRYQWVATDPRIRKCDMCFSRIEEGLAPACTKACPTGTTIFGDRDELIRIARKRLSDHPERYHQHIYGLTEVGGTCCLSIAGIPLEEIFYPKDLATASLAVPALPSWTAVSPPMIGFGAFLGVMAVIAERNNSIAHEKK